MGFAHMRYRLSHLLAHLFTRRKILEWVINTHNLVTSDNCGVYYCHYANYPCQVSKLSTATGSRSNTFYGGIFKYEKAKVPFYPKYSDLNS